MACGASAAYLDDPAAALGASLAVVPLDEWAALDDSADDAALAAVVSESVETETASDCSFSESGG